MYRKHSDKFYYVYAYLRSADSATAPAGTPYYIGKGRGRRTHEKHYLPIPSDPQCIVKLAENLTEQDSHQIEMLLIYFHGRVDLGTGILRNRTDGGDGTSGAIVSQATRELKRQMYQGIPRPEYVIAKLKGQKRSPETLERLKNRVFPSDWIDKVREGNKRRSQSLEWRQKIRDNALARMQTEEGRAHQREISRRGSEAHVRNSLAKAAMRASESGSLFPPRIP